MSKIEGKYNTEYPNIPVYHSPLYNMRASSMLRKEHPNEKKNLFCFKLTTNFQYILCRTSLYTGANVEVLERGGRSMSASMVGRRKKF